MKLLLLLALLTSSFNIWSSAQFRDQVFFEEYEKLEFTVHKINLPHELKGWSLLYEQEREYEMYVAIELCTYDGQVSEKNIRCKEVNRTRNFLITSQGYPNFVSSTPKSKISVTASDLKRASNLLENKYPDEGQFLNVKLIRFEDRVVRRDLHEDMGDSQIYLTTLALDHKRYVSSYSDLTFLKYTFKTNKYFIHHSENIYAVVDLMVYPKK